MENKTKLEVVIGGKSIVVEAEPERVNFVRRRTFDLGQPAWYIQYTCNKMPIGEIDTLIDALSVENFNDIESVRFFAEGELADEFINSEAKDRVIDMSAIKDFFNALDNKKELVLDIKLYFKK